MNDTAPFAYLSSNAVTVKRLRNSVTGAAITDGVTLTATLCAVGSDAPISGAATTGLNFVPDTSGTWSGTFSRDTGAVVGEFYDLLLVADGGAFLTRRWRLRCQVTDSCP